MVRLDIGTLAWSAAILSLACSLVIAVAGGARRGDRIWVKFALALFCYGTGLLVILLAPPALPHSLALHAGDLLLLLSAIPAQAGACALAGLPWRGVRLWLPLALAAAIAAGVLLGLDGTAARFALVSLARVPLLGHAALALAVAARRSPAAGLPLLAATFAGWTIEQLLRGSLAVSESVPDLDFPELGGIEIVNFLLSALAPLLIAVALVGREGTLTATVLAAEVARQTAALQRRTLEAEAADRSARDQILLRDALINALPGPVFAKSLDGHFLAINQAFEQAFGFPRQQLLGQSNSAFLAEDLARRHAAADRLALEADTPCCYETTLCYADQRPRRVLIRKLRFRDCAGRVAGVVGAFTDISELSRVSEDLRRSEADLRAILDNMTDVFYRTDAEGRWLMLSRSVETVLGYSAPELLGQPATEITVVPELRSSLLETMQRQGGSVTDFEFQVRRKTGEAVWVSTSARLRQDGDGHFYGSEGTLRLIEDRKRTEASLRGSQSLIQALVNCSADAILLIDQAGLLVAGNAVLAQRLGRPVESLIGADLWSLFPSEVASWRREAVRGVLISGQPGRIVDRRNGRVFDNTLHPVPDADGRVTRVAVFSRDITEQTEAQARLERSIAEVQRSNAELEQFAYVASHDLREPLRMISTYLSLIERRYAPAFDPEGREFLAFAREGAQRMDRLVLDLLDYARIGRRGETHIPCFLRAAIDQAVHILGPTIAACGADLSVETSLPEPLVQADTAQMTRLLQNLISNALKYRRPDLIPQIRINCRRTDDQWRIDVADNGIGIETAYFEQIFRIFQRLHPQDRYEGTGIGLAICKRIVEQHGGRIWVESLPGEGSVFSFTLPAADSAALPA
mgnify:CR=1 FL=1